MSKTFIEVNNDGITFHLKNASENGSPGQIELFQEDDNRFYSIAKNQKAAMQQFLGNQPYKKFTVSNEKKPTENGEKSKTEGKVGNVRFYDSTDKLSDGLYLFYEDDFDQLHVKHFLRMQDLRKDIYDIFHNTNAMNYTIFQVKGKEIKKTNNLSYITPSPLEPSEEPYVEPSPEKPLSAELAVGALGLSLGLTGESQVPKPTLDHIPTPTPTSDETIATELAVGALGLALGLTGETQVPTPIPSPDETLASELAVGALGLSLGLTGETQVPTPSPSPSPTPTYKPDETLAPELAVGALALSLGLTGETQVPSLEYKPDETLATELAVGALALTLASEKRDKGVYDSDSDNTPPPTPRPSPNNEIINDFIKGGFPKEPKKILETLKKLGTNDFLERIDKILDQYGVLLFDLKFVKSVVDLDKGIIKNDSEDKQNKRQKGIFYDEKLKIKEKIEKHINRVSGLLAFKIPLKKLYNCCQPPFNQVPNQPLNNILDSIGFKSKFRIKSESFKKFNDALSNFFFKNLFPEPTKNKKEDIFKLNIETIQNNLKTTELYLYETITKDLKSKFEEFQTKIIGQKIPEFSVPEYSTEDLKQDQTNESQLTGSEAFTGTTETANFGTATSTESSSVSSKESFNQNPQIKDQIKDQISKLLPNIGGSKSNTPFTPPAYNDTLLTPSVTPRSEYEEPLKVQNINEDSIWRSISSNVVWKSVSTQDVWNSFQTKSSKIKLESQSQSQSKSKSEKNKTESEKTKNEKLCALRNYINGSSLVLANISSSATLETVTKIEEEEKKDNEIINEENEDSNKPLLPEHKKTKYNWVSSTALLAPPKTTQDLSIHPPSNKTQVNTKKKSGGNKSKKSRKTKKRKFQDPI
jgi:hypothetical protein